MGPRSARQPDGPQELQCKSVGPILFRQVLKFAALSCARVVNDDVDLPEGLDSEFCQAPGSVRYSQIECHRRSLPAGVFDLANGGLERIPISRTEDNTGAFLCQTNCNRPSDSPARAGDYCNL